MLQEAPCFLILDPHRCTGCTGFFRKRLACNPEHPQTRTGSSPKSASPAAADRPAYPVHPVNPCLFVFLTWMHRIYRIIVIHRLALVEGIEPVLSREPASPATTSHSVYPVHPVHRCSIAGPSRLICPVAYVRYAQHSVAALGFSVGQSAPPKPRRALRREGRSAATGSRPNMD